MPDPCLASAASAQIPEPSRGTVLPSWALGGSEKTFLSAPCLGSVSEVGAQGTNTFALCLWAGD